MIRTAGGVAAGLAAVSVLAGCSAAGAKAAGNSVSPLPTTSLSQETLCTQQEIIAVLPSGVQMIDFKCATTGDKFYGAARVNPGPTIFFLVDKDGRWDVETSDQICGSAKAGLPSDIQAYCPAPTPTGTTTKKPKSPTASTSASPSVTPTPSVS